MRSCINDFNSLVRLIIASSYDSPTYSVQFSKVLHFIPKRNSYGVTFVVECCHVLYARSINGNHSVLFTRYVSANLRIAVENVCTNLSICPLCDGQYAATVLCHSTPIADFNLLRDSLINPGSLSLVILLNGQKIQTQFMRFFAMSSLDFVFMAYFFVNLLTTSCMYITPISPLILVS